MTRDTRLCAHTIIIFIFICLTGFVSGFNVTVHQTPERINTTEDKTVTITCYINVESKAERIRVRLFKYNSIEMDRRVFNVSDYRSNACLDGFVCFNATTRAPIKHQNHTGTYYCEVWIDLPTLGPKEYGKGTYIFVARSTLITSPKPANMTEAGDGYDDTVMWSLLSGLSIILLIICISCVIHRHYKGRCRSEHKAAEALPVAVVGSGSPDILEAAVVYAAINIPKSRDSVKSKNESCAALMPKTVTSTEESVTYSEVSLKGRPMDES